MLNNMKKAIITISIILLYICSYSQTLQYGYNNIYDSLKLVNSDTLNQVNYVLPDKQFTWVYGINYGDIDSTTIQIFVQASIPSLGWVTISDTATIDSTSTARSYYLTGTTPPYPEIKLITKRDTTEIVREGWIKEIFFTRVVE